MNDDDCRIATVNSRWMDPETAFANTVAVRWQVEVYDAQRQPAGILKFQGRPRRSGSPVYGGVILKKRQLENFGGNWESHDELSVSGTATQKAWTSS